jgi:hypothetical protein
MPGELPWWLIFILGAIVGSLATLAVGPTSTAFWSAVYTVRYWCTVLGAVVLGGGILGGVCYLLYRWKFAGPS